MATDGWLVEHVKLSQQLSNPKSQEVFSRCTFVASPLCLVTLMSTVESCEVVALSHIHARLKLRPTEYEKRTTKSYGQ
jgi:hypothetical protein